MTTAVIVEPPVHLTPSRSDFKHLLRLDPCAVCSAPGDTIDHITPRAHGGRSNVGNLAAMCEQHNMAKGDETLLLWLLDRHAGSASIVAECATT